MNSPCGTVYEMAREQNGWSEAVIWNFEGDNDGAFPNAVSLNNYLVDKPTGQYYFALWIAAANVACPSARSDENN
jgi:hypothetical protein